VSSVDLSKLTAVVYTSERARSIARLVASVQRQYPELRLLVADDSRQPRPVAGADWIRLPADVGVSAGRNAALARVRTPYFLLLEDELELTRRAHLEKLVALVAENRLDVAAGDCVRCTKKLLVLTSRAPDPAHATFEFTGDTLRLCPGHRSADARFLDCDLAHNFFVARTDKVRSMGGWDPQLAVDERIEFFVRAERFGLRVGVCPDAVAQRWTSGESASRSATRRDFKTLALAKMGVSRLIDQDGRTLEAAVHKHAA
jgi:hypothetical protein